MTSSASPDGLHRRRSWSETTKNGYDSHDELNVSVASSSSSIPSPLHSKAEQGHHKITAQRFLDMARTLNQPTKSVALPRSVVTYHHAKWCILRLLGLVYWFAFVGAYYQNEGLFGEHGIAPADLTAITERYQHSSWQGFRHYPMVFEWWGLLPYNDMTMRGVVCLGILVSTLVTFGGVNSWLLQAILWLLDFSIVTVAHGNSFYGYGWESQLLETGFLAIFLCQLPSIYLLPSSTHAPSPWWTRLRVQFACWEEPGAFSLDNNTVQSPAGTEPSPVILWLFRWLCFRISLGAGLIKVRGSSCWTDKTCLQYHFETQPIPSPLSFVYHFLPRMVQSHMVDIDLFVQLYTSGFVLIPLEWFVAAPRPVFRAARGILRAAGVLQVGFMMGIILSGNFAFLNHLTIVPALACWDDGFFASLWQRPTGSKTTCDTRSGTASTIHQPSKASSESTLGNYYYSPWWKRPRRWLDIALLCWIAWLSRPVVDNLLQRRQVMNASFDPFRIVNTYGAFGSVGTARYEAIIQVSHDGTTWTELELPCQPGNVRRRPCFCAPYHYRLDWNIWFIGFKPHQLYLRKREYWMFGLLSKIIEPTSGTTITKEQQQQQPRPWLDLLDQTTADFLKKTYYEQGKSPRFVKVDMYRYRMADPLWDIIRKWVSGQDVVWWKRKFEEKLIPALYWDSQNNQPRFV